MVLGGIFKVFILRCQNLSANRYEKINIKNRTQVLQVWDSGASEILECNLKKKIKACRRSLSSDTKRPATPGNSSLVPLVSFFTCCAEWPVPAWYFCSPTSVPNDYWLMLSCAHFWFRQSGAWSTKLLNITSNSFKQVYIQRHFM